MEEVGSQIVVKIWKRETRGTSKMTFDGQAESVTAESEWRRTYDPFEVSGGDVEADGDVDADARTLVIVAQRHPLVNLLGQSQGRLHLNNRAGPKSTGGNFGEA